jgi:alpha-glucosidase (family GH31 glycosyl hydrolase)
MTWNSNFNGVDSFLETLDNKGRGLAVIIDPHIKTDGYYFIYNDAKANGKLVNYN